MAQKIQDPAFDIRDTAQWYLNDVLRQLKVNTETQCIYPREIYKGFKAVNAARGARQQWSATGEGVNSFNGRIVSATPDTWTYEFTYNDYMRFVDMGVGLGTRYHDVDSARKARFNSRYVRQWKRYGAGRSQRPAIMMELRHLLSRMQNYLVDFYGYSGETKLIKAFETEDFQIPVIV
mgnify:CR=1 FL=1